ncbi:type 1 fimbrial protein [Enterobacter bugandensis]|uniref:Type 1 fimbrial protein n=1 Tax=Enterobacter bugandensis TaxID=881260 RepID=A0AA42PXA2_9ENTR|nr:fimbrial protein [Enterobacter bugandensis]MDH1321538.1 type 1 fimbrial protein [Enterobacter bugandensis]
MKQVTQPVLHMSRERIFSPRYLLLLGCLLLLSAGVQAVTSVNGMAEGGEHGVLQVTGALTQGSCRLDMQSANQIVDLGNTEMVALKRLGYRGTPVAVQLFLRDCQVSGGRQADAGTVEPSQSGVTVSFRGVQDADNSVLLKVVGASGFGLRLMDRRMRDVPLGSGGLVQPLNSDNSELTYYVVPERTRAPLIGGAYRAVVDFRLSYD